MVDMPLVWWARPLGTALGMAKLFRGGPVGSPWASLEKIARRRSGVSAELDSDFRTEMQFLLNAVLVNGNLTALGKISIRQMIIRRLTTHLRLAHELRQHPEINDVPIRRPLFIVGLPGTGSTLLYRLLGCDPAHRAPLLWQLLTPPYPLDAPQSDIHHRILRAQRYVRLTVAAAPALRAIHDLDVHQPEESHYLLPHSPHYHAIWPNPQYLQWLNQRDLRPDYEYFKKQLQVMQWKQSERRWVLKSPLHLGSLHALLSAFPDAMIIQTHRAPAAVLASFCGLVEAVALVANRRIDRAQIGQDWLAIWSEAMSRAVRVRHTVGRHRFIDVYYDHLMVDPLGTIENVYRDFGENLSPEGRGHMVDYLDQDRRGTYGAHRYSLERYGLTASVVRRAFADYGTYFDMP